MKESPDIHIPGPSFWPIIVAGGLVLIAIGVVSSFTVSIIGILILLIAIGGWAIENRSEEEANHE
jgi:hypothetical protein